MIGVHYNLKNAFFDRPKVKAAVSDQTRKVLGYAGGDIRRQGRRSMKSGGKKRKASAAGTPPNRHTNDNVTTLRNILFGFESKTSIIVGPIRLNQKHVIEGQLMHGTVPGIHEKGGVMGHREKWLPYDLNAAQDVWGRHGGLNFVSQFGALPSGFWRKLYGDEEFNHRNDSQLRGIWVPVGRKRRDRWHTRVRNAKYPRRQFMEPAVQHVMGSKFPNLYVRTSAGPGALSGAA